MKISLLLVLSLFAAAQASAQAVELQSGADPREIKLYRATVRTMAGERISGIFYAMTDSTLVFFASDRAAIRQFRAGQLPKLDTVDATNVKRLAVRQKGQILRSLTLGLVTGAIVSCVSILMSRPARSTIISGVSNGVGQVLGNYYTV